MNTSDNKTVTQFRELLRRFERELFMQKNECCCNGITMAQCHTLLEIDSKKKESLTELSKTLGLDKSTVCRTVDGLVNMGLLDRSTPSENRRMSTIQLTELGKKVCNNINSENDDYFTELLKTLSVSEQTCFVTILEKLIIGMKALRTQQEKNCCQ
ncbi:MAG: MarR family transcriptional regulator [Bacteroidales bacterium]|jgi:DNA-binding MarR family transcriptional regulator|nr:MarR family transcriptional regulator [Bacteroidales bacterium]